MPSPVDQSRRYRSGDPVNLGESLPEGARLVSAEGRQGHLDIIHIDLETHRASHARGGVSDVALTLTVTNNLRLSSPPQD